MTLTLSKKPDVAQVTKYGGARGYARSKLERHFELILLSQDVRKLFPLLQAFVTEHRFCDADFNGKDRRWRFDFCWPVYGRNHAVCGGVGLEIQGGIHMTGKTRGAHVRGARYELDAEKYNTAVWQGWAVYLATANMIRKEPMKLLQMLNDSVLHAIEVTRANGS